MSRLVRIAGRTLLVLLVVVLAALAAAYGFSQTDRFREIVRREIAGRGGEAIAGDLAIGAVEGSVWSAVVLRDVVLRDGGEVVLQIPILRLRYDLPGIVRGRLRVEAIEAERPVVTLRENGPGDWGLLRAVTPVAAEPEEPSAEGGGLPLAIALEALRIESLEASIEPAAGEPVRLRKVDLEASADVEPGGVVARIGSLRGTLVLAGRPEIRIAARGAYDGVASPPVVRIDDLAASTDRSGLALRGSVRGIEEPESDLRLVAEPLAAADLNALVPGLGLRPDVTGEVTLAGPLRDLRATASLAAAEARVEASAKVDATGDDPPWELRLDASGVDLAQLLEQDDARGRIEARIEARGRGAVPAALGGEATLTGKDLAYADWRPGDLTLEVVTEGRVATLDGRLEPGRGEARLTGEIDLSEAERFDLRLVTSRLAPWRTERKEPAGDVNLEARFRGRGFSAQSLDARAEATMKPSTLGGLSLGGATLEATAAAGTAKGRLDVRRFRSGENRFETARATFDVAGLDAERREAAVDLVVERLVAGLEVRRLELGTKTTLGDAIESSIELRAVDRASRPHRAAATVVASGDRLRVVLARLDLDLPGGAWALAAPATIERRGDDLTIDRFVARSGARSVTVAGRVSASGAQDLALRFDGVDLASFAPLLPKGAEPGGRLSADVRLAGTAAAPRLDASLGARALRVSAVRAESLDVTLGYHDASAMLELDLRQDAAHALEARASVPVEIAWAPSWTFRPGRAADLPLDVHVRSDGLDLSFLEAFADESLRNVRGTLALDVTARGTAGRPEPSGTVVLRDGAAELPSLGLKLRELGAELGIAPDRLTLVRLSGRSGEGRLEGEGRVTLRDLVPDAVEAGITLERWPAIRTTRYRATVGGAVEARGTFDAPDVRGRLEILSATLRPDLDFLANRPPERDETIVLVGEGAPAPVPQVAEEDPAVGETVNRWEALDLDVAVDVKRNVWVKQEGTAIELSGTIEARKPRGGELQVVGKIVTRRGWARFQGKRFRIVEGEIGFTGGREIDPSLDVVARHRVRGYTVDVVVRGTASAPELELRSDPPLEQADVLAVLLFGKPTSELSEGEESKLGDQAAALATSFAVSEVSQKLTRALGVESLGIQVEEVSTERAAVGAYVTERTYVSVAQDLSGDEGREVSVEYELLPPNWSVVTSTNTAGESGGDVIWKKRY